MKETYTEHLSRVRAMVDNLVPNTSNESLKAVLAEHDRLRALLRRYYPLVAGRAIRARAEAGDAAAREWEQMAADIHNALEANHAD